jgi:hypothetical protein
MSLAPDRVEPAFAALRRHIEQRYGIGVRLLDLPAAFLGDLDGADIYLQHGPPTAATLFTLGHLFGHTVQWNLDARLRNLGGKPCCTYTPEDLQEIAAYETDASRYALALLHQAGLADLDQWLTDFAACDLAYLDHYYRTGERLPPLDFWHDNRPLLAPLPIPPFTPHRFQTRTEGVVI